MSNGPLTLGDTSLPNAWLVRGLVRRGQQIERLFFRVFATDHNDAFRIASPHMSEPTVLYQLW